MKNIFKLLFALVFVVNFSCQDSSNVIDEVLDYETGAILRTVSLDNGVLNTSDASSEFLVTVEYQDEQDGALLESVDVWTYFRDISPDNGTTPENRAYVYTVDASAFSTDTPHGLPRAQLSMQMGQALSATGQWVARTLLAPALKNAATKPEKPGAFISADWATDRLPIINIREVKIVFSFSDIFSPWKNIIFP